jgi:hypothetical protein
MDSPSLSPVAGVILFLSYNNNTCTHSPKDHVFIFHFLNQKNKEKKINKIEQKDYLAVWQGQVSDNN